MKGTTDIPWDEILSVLKGDSTLKEEQFLDEWMKADSSNSALFAELAQLWESIVTENDYSPNVDAALAEFKSETILKLRRDRRRKAVSLTIRGIVAACAICMVFLSYHMGYKKSHEDSKKVLHIKTYATNANGADIRLSDGTEVFLRENARLELAKEGREVVLSGEAFFNVAKSEKEQFRVTTGNCSVTVYGTKFNVRTDQQTKNVIVSLYEGAVTLNSPSCTAQMKPGDIALCSPSGEIRIEDGDVLSENCWMSDSLPLRGATLGEVCKCLSRWYNITIDVDKSIENVYKYNFTLHDERLDDVLNMMSLASPIRYKYRLDGSVQVAKSTETR